MRRHGERRSREDLIEKSNLLVANVLAVLTALLLGPLLYNGSVDYAVVFVQQQYVPGYEALTRFIWAVLTGLIIFGLARTGWIILAGMATTGLIMRFA